MEVLTLTAPWANPEESEWESSYSTEFLCATTIASPDVERSRKGGHCLKGCTEKRKRQRLADFIARTLLFARAWRNGDKAPLQTPVTWP